MIDTKFFAYKSSLIHKIFGSFYQTQLYIKHMEQKINEIQTEWKSIFSKFTFDIETIEKYIKKEIEIEMSTDLTLGNIGSSDELVINDLKLMVSKGITSKGMLKFLEDECLNKDDLTKQENNFNQRLSRIEEIITLEVFGTVEHIVSTCSQLSGLAE